MPFNAAAMEELNLLLQFESASTGSGIKVHSRARPEVTAACRNLYDTGLISQEDGGYLTDAGIEALTHVQVLSGLLALKRPG